MNEEKAMLDNQQGERGVVLIIALFLVLALFILGTSYLGLAGTESKIASNEISSTKAFGLAEAGIDLAKQRLRNSNDWDAVIADTQPFDCPDLGLGADGGCSYLIEDDDDGDADPTSDRNRTVVIKSTGDFRSGEREIHIAYTMPIFPGGPGAVSFTGVDSRIDYSGSSGSIDGNNWIPPSEDRVIPAVLDNAACGPGSGPQFGISTPDVPQKDNLHATISSSDGDQILGSAPSPPWSPVDPTPSIGVVPGYLSFSEVETIADALLARADRVFTPGDTALDEVLGTQSAPMIHAVNCTGYTGSLCLKLDGATQGTGFLIVKNGNVLLRATASWVGVIIVYGTNIKFDTGGGGGPGNIIYGQVLVAEDTFAIAKQFRPRNTVVRYSCDGIAMANMAAGWNPGKDVVWWKEAY